MRKLLYTLPFILIFTGCGSKQFYTLGDTSSVVANGNYTQGIAVEKVEVPKYLQDSEIVRQTTPYHVVLVEDANWLTPMEKRLTNVLISYLQKSLNNPNVHLYPWDTNKEVTKRVSLKIKRFIAYKDNVQLEASYTIRDEQSKKRETKLFSTKVATTQDVEGMMAAMEKAYFQLSDEIKTKITN